MVILGLLLIAARRVWRSSRRLHRRARGQPAASCSAPDLSAVALFLVGVGTGRRDPRGASGIRKFGHRSGACGSAARSRSSSRSSPRSSTSARPSAATDDDKHEHRTGPRSEPPQHGPARACAARSSLCPSQRGPAHLDLHAARRAVDRQAVEPAPLARGDAAAAAHPSRAARQRRGAGQRRQVGRRLGAPVGVDQRGRPRRARRRRAAARRGRRRRTAWPRHARRLAAGLTAAPRRAATASAGDRARAGVEQPTRAATRARTSRRTSPPPW